MKQMFTWLLISLSTIVRGHSNIPLRNGPVSRYSMMMDRDLMPNQNINLPESEKSGQKMKIFRLPTDVQPVIYDLKMIPYLSGNFTFKGEVSVLVHVNKATNTILMHSHKLEINSVEIFKSGKKITSKFSLMVTDQILNITTLHQKLYPANKVTVNVTFSGLLNDEMVGFYRSHYKLGNSTKWLATTQFESTNARRAFPCFDEPQLRATFNVSIARYNYQKAISNMPLDKTSAPDTSIGNRVWDTFKMSPPMPTYLLAFIVSEFGYRPTSEPRVKVWARENALDDTSYGLSQAIELIKHMENYTKIPFALPKIDVAAIPDFLAGAMENWGLTTYRERYVLYNEKFCPETCKEYITSVIAHEFAHQWFGNLVTIAWWDYIWLNEGFATYFEYFLTAMKETEWRMEEKFVTDVVHSALRVDGITLHIAMTSSVLSPSEIDSKFDYISYKKGGSVIRMLSHIMSPTTFKKALFLYLQTRRDAGGVADPSHLFDAFEEQMQKEGKSLPHDLTITAVAKKFSEQVGYPCITVKRQKNMTISNITIKQEPYKSIRAWQNVTQKTWYVPLTCTKQSELNFANTQPTIWLIDDKEIVLSNVVKNNEWYLCNIQQTGYYRVNYDLENWSLIIKQLHSSHSKIHALNRAQLIDDIYSLTLDEHLSFELLFDLFRYLEHEVDPIPWYTALEKIYHLVHKYEFTMASTELLHFAQHLIGNLYKNIGFYEKTADSHSIKTMRPRLLFFASILDLGEVVLQAKTEYSSKTDLSEIPAYAKETVLCTAIRENSTFSVWSRLWDLYRKSNFYKEQETVLMALGCTTNEILLKNYLSKLFNDSDHDIHVQQRRYVFGSISRFQSGVLASINFVHDILTNLGNHTNANETVIQTLRRIVYGNVNSQSQIHRLEHVIEEAEKLDQQKFGSIKNMLIRIKVNGLQLIESNEKKAKQIYAALSTKEPTTVSPPKPSAGSYTAPQIITIFTVIILKFVWLAV